jgi:hypothetical protein
MNFWLKVNVEWQISVRPEAQHFLQSTNMSDYKMGVSKLVHLPAFTSVPTLLSDSI